MPRRSSASRAASEHVKRSASWSARSSPSTAASASARGPGELYDQKKFDTPYIRDFLLDRGVLADVSETVGAVERARPALRRRDRRGRAKAFAELGVRGLDHVPPLALVPLGRVPLLHVRVRGAPGPDAARAVRHGQGGDPAGVHGRRRDALAPPRGGLEHARWLEQDISRRGRDDGPGAVRRRRPGATSTRARSRGLPRRPGSATMEACTSNSHPAGWSPSRSRARRSRSPRPPSGHPRSRRPRHSRDQGTALVPGPLYGLRTWSVVGADGEERLEGPQQPAPWPVDGEWLTRRAPSTRGTPLPSRAARADPRVAPAPERGAPRARLPRPRLRRRRGRRRGEVHRDGFRAERARPRAFFATPQSNTALLGRLPRRHAPRSCPSGARTGSSPGAGSTTSGSTPPSSTSCSAPRASRRPPRAPDDPAPARRRRVAIAAMLFLGLELTANPGDRPLFGRTGPVQGSP